MDLREIQINWLNENEVKVTPVDYLHLSVLRVYVTTLLRLLSS
jgi:hypothetical protein